MCLMQIQHALLSSTSLLLQTRSISQQLKHAALLIYATISDGFLVCIYMYIIAWTKYYFKFDRLKYKLINNLTYEIFMLYLCVYKTNYLSILVDFVKVDLTPPSAGVVLDGSGLEDLDYTSMESLVASSWHGFSDSESYIDYYTVCAGISPFAGDILPCRNVGLHIHHEERSQQPLPHGQVPWGKDYTIMTCFISWKHMVSST